MVLLGELFLELSLWVRNEDMEAEFLTTGQLCAWPYASDLVPQCLNLLVTQWRLKYSIFAAHFVGMCLHYSDSSSGKVA